MKSFALTRTSGSPAMKNTRAQEIVDFWIGPAADDPAEAKARGKLWYQSTPESDDEIREQFGGDLARAEHGELDFWASTPEGSLALVILLDQFSRNLYRGTARAFSNDAHALRIAGEAIAAKQHEELPYMGRAFLYHPFHHAESLAHQDLSVSLFEALYESVEAPWQDQVLGFLKYAREHREVVRRFGRFPHRNRVLSRENTPEEQEYLDAGANSYGQ